MVGENNSWKLAIQGLLFILWVVLTAIVSFVNPIVGFFMFLIAVGFVWTSWTDWSHD